MSRINYYLNLINKEFRGKKIISILPGKKMAESTIKLLESAEVEDFLMIIPRSDLEANHKFTYAKEKYIGVGRYLKTDSALDIIDDFQTAIDVYSLKLAKILEQFDPEKNAIVLGPSFLSIRSFYGRKVIGTRLKSWERLEDKFISDKFFDKVDNIKRAPSKICKTLNIKWLKLFQKFNWGDGLVIIGQSESGMTGGGRHIFYAKNSVDLDRVSAQIEEKYQTVKVMPFLKGVSYSSHGVVVGKSTVCIPPFECITLRRNSDNGFLWCGTATSFVLNNKYRQEISRVTKRVGRRLQNQLGYKGFFCIDGIMTKRGFIVTEINTRMGGSAYILGNLSKKRQEWLGLLDMLIRSNSNLKYRPMELQKIFNSLHREHSVVLGMVRLDKIYKRKKTYMVLNRRGQLALGQGRKRVGKASLIPAKFGSFLQVNIDASKIVTRKMNAKIIHDLFMNLDRKHKLGLSNLTID